MYKPCMPGTCFSEVDIRDRTVKRFRTLTETGKLQFKDASQKDISLPVLFLELGLPSTPC